MSKQRFEFIEGSHSKFWEITTKKYGDSYRVITTYGRIGNTGTESWKEYASKEAADKEESKLIKSKTTKGYYPV